MNNTSKDDVREYIVMVNYEEEIETSPLPNLKPNDYQEDRKTNNKKSGSGIIIKPTDSSSYFYILTAYHTFPKKPSNIKLKNIKLYYEYEIKNPISLSVCDFFEIKDYDILILILDLNDKENSVLKNTDNYLEVLDGDFSNNDELSYIFSGYSNNLREINTTLTSGDDFKDEIGSYNCKYHGKNDPRKNLIEFKTEHSLDSYTAQARENIKGASGGGVL